MSKNRCLTWEKAIKKWTSDESDGAVQRVEIFGIFSALHGIFRGLWLTGGTVMGTLRGRGEPMGYSGYGSYANTTAGHSESLYGDVVSPLRSCRKPM